MLLFILFIGILEDKETPLLFGAGTGVHFVQKEVYWNELFSENGAQLRFEEGWGGWAKANIGIKKFYHFPGYKYKDWYKEFVRVSEIFLYPKLIFYGYNIGSYKLKGKASEFGNINIDIIPIGLSMGVFSGSLPCYPYIEVGVGTPIVFERWDLKKGVGGRNPSGSCQSMGFYFAGSMGMLWQFSEKIAANISGGYNWVMSFHGEEKEMPTSSQGIKNESLNGLEFRIGLIFGT